MARRRVTEADLLDFRAKAEELSQKLEVKYDKLEKKMKAAEDLEVKEKGVLVIHYSDTDEESVDNFVRGAKGRGYAAQKVTLNTFFGERTKSERIIVWQELLEQAQEGYSKLSERADNISVVGIGDAVPVAVVICEQYPAAALCVTGAGPVMKPFNGKRHFAKLAGLARNNLFSIICPVLALVPADCGSYKNASVKLYQDNTRAPEVEIEETADVSVNEMWTKREHELETRIFDFIDRV